MAFRSFRNVFHHHHNHNNEKSNGNSSTCSLPTSVNDFIVEKTDNNSTQSTPRHKFLSGKLCLWSPQQLKRRVRSKDVRVSVENEVNAIAGGATNASDCNSNMSPSNNRANVAAAAAAAALLHNEGYRPPAKNCHRLVILGSSRVGKTCIVSRFLNNKYDDKYTPTIEDFHRKLYRIRGEVYQLDILDTSGNHPFPAMRRLSFLTGDLFILVYSIDNRDSYDEVRRLRDQILETKVNAQLDNGSSSTRTNRKLPRIPMVIVGNKCDKESDRMVDAEEVTTFVSELTSCAFLETSAKKNVHIEDVFCELFLLGNLPLEMSPSLHKKVQPGYVGFCQIGARKKGLPLRRRLSDAYGTIATNARRPSLRTDLLILQAKATDPSGSGGNHGGSRDYTKDISCVLQ